MAYLVPEKKPGARRWKPLVQLKRAAGYMDKTARKLALQRLRLSNGKRNIWN
jgi:hypothetical protein